MTSFWLWVCLGCAASAALAFSLVRYAIPSLPRFHPVAPESVPVRGDRPPELREPRPVAAAATPVRELPAEPLVDLPAEPARSAPRGRPAHARPASKRRPHAARMPAPTAPQPDAAQLIVWARQITAGERKMSLTSDGCRVTWDRTCKHGHPTWVVRLGYLERPRPPVEHRTQR